MRERKHVGLKPFLIVTGRWPVEAEVLDRKFHIIPLNVLEGYEVGLITPL